MQFNYVLNFFSLFINDFGVLDAFLLIFVCLIVDLLLL